MRKKKLSPGVLAAAGVTAVAALPREQATTAAAALGAFGSLGVLVGVYRIPLNRCRCSRDERERSHTGRFHMHCRRCLKRTNKGIAVSFLSSPVYVACAAVGAVQVVHAAGTPVLRGVVKPTWGRLKQLAKWV